MKTLRQFSLKPVLILIKIKSASDTITENVSLDAGANSATPIDNQTESTIVVTKGTLHITLDWDAENDGAINFNEFKFTFGANKQLIANKGNNSYYGTWTIKDASGAIEKLSNFNCNITFKSPLNFVEIVDEWKVIEKSSTYRTLRNIIASDRSQQHLTFSIN